MLSPAYIGFLHELRGYSDRSGAVPATKPSIPTRRPEELSTFASPYVAIAATQKGIRLWDTDIAMSSIYLSLILSSLAIAALWMRPRDAFRWWLASMGLLCLAAAVGDVLPIRGWLYDRAAADAILSPLGHVSLLFRDFGRRAGDFCGPRSERNDRRTQPLLLETDCVDVLGYNRLSPGDLDRRLCGDGARPQNPAHGVDCRGSNPLGWRGHGSRGFSASRARQTDSSSFGRHLTRLCILDAVLTVVLSQPTMNTDRRNIWPSVEAAQDYSIDLTARGLARQETWSPGPQTPLNACLVGKVPVLHAFNVLRNELFRQSMEQPVLAESALGNDRIWFSPAASLEPADQATLLRLATRCKSLGRPCLVLSDPQQVRAGSCWPESDAMLPRNTPLENLPPAVRCPIKLERYDGRCLEFKATCPSDGWLLVTHRWAPSWRAWVNGQPKQDWIGNLVFRAVPVERGENQVRFEYHPFCYPWLIVASWLTLGLVLIGSIKTIGMIYSANKARNSQTGEE